MALPRREELTFKRHYIQGLAHKNKGVLKFSNRVFNLAANSFALLFLLTCY